MNLTTHSNISERESLSSIDLLEKQHYPFKIYVGVLGNIFAFIFFLSPIPMIIKICKRKLDPLQTPYLIFIMNCMTCLLWLSYGIIIFDEFLIFSNIVGLTINFVYLSIYIIIIFKKRGFTTFFLIIGSIIFAGFVLFILAFAIDNQPIAEYSAMIFNIFMLAAPGQKAVEAIKTKNNELIPFTMTALALVGSSIWLTYGILPLFNIFIVIPNGLGILFCLINLTIYFCISLPQKEIKDTGSPSEGSHISVDNNDHNHIQYNEYNDK